VKEQMILMENRNGMVESREVEKSGVLKEGGRGRKESEVSEIEK
jgi:hypothetical protein